MPARSRLGLAAALLASAALAAPALALPGAPAPDKGGPRDDKASSSTVQEPQVDTCTESNGRDVAGTSTYSGPQKLWPPNHKHVAGQAVWADEDAGDMVTVSWMATHDQIVDGEELNGSGNTSDDITPATGTEMGQGSITQDFLVRAERSGRVQAGRTYRIAGTMTTSDSDMDDSSEDMTRCDFEFLITVPHDQGREKA